MEGNTYYASKEINGKLSCWKIELKEGGLISRDDTDPNCTANTFTPSAVLSEFDGKITDGEFSFQNFDNQGWSGNIKFKQKANITDPEFELKSSTSIEFYLPSCNYITCENRSQTKFTLDLLTDRYPDETSWDIVNDCTGETLFSGTSEGIDVCIDPGSFTFTIRDRYSDGICCEYGNGSYSLFYNNNIIKSGGSFGASESTTFGDQGCPSCQVSFLQGKTLFVPAFSQCWKIELYRGGKLTSGTSTTEENCSNGQFQESEIISNLTNLNGNRANFSRIGGFSGYIKFKSDPNIQIPQVETRTIDVDKKYFEIIVTLQSCQG